MRMRNNVGYWIMCPQRGITYVTLKGEEAQIWVWCGMDVADNDSPWRREYLSWAKGRKFNAVTMDAFWAFVEEHKEFILMDMEQTERLVQEVMTREST